jgi:hypothetical protein
MTSFLAYFVLSIVILLSMVGFGIILHELGHMIAYKMITGKSPKLRFKRSLKGFDFVAVNREEASLLTEKQHRAITISGVICGFLSPLLFMPFIKTSIFMILLLGFLLIYNSGIKHDWRNLRKCQELERN